MLAGVITGKSNSSSLAVDLNLVANYAPNNARKREPLGDSVQKVHMTVYTGFLGERSLKASRVCQLFMVGKPKR